MKCCPPSLQEMLDGKQIIYFIWPYANWDNKQFRIIEVFRITQVLDYAGSSVARK